MATEETALLADRADRQPSFENANSGVTGGDIYNRFSKAEKRMVVVVVSFAGLVPLFVGGSFVPSIPQISKDLDLSPALISLAISLSVLANAFGGLVWSAYSSFYGRRPMYLWGMPLMAMGSFGTAYSIGLQDLLFWRFVQAFGCSGAMPIGAAVIGDIYALEERGTAMGSFFGASLFGLAVAPLTGGTAAQYWSWRGFQIALGTWGFVQMAVMYLYLPETAHPNTRGIDKVKEGERPRKRLVWINPFGSLVLLRSPIVLMMTVANAFVINTDYALMIPLAYTIGDRYNISNEAIIGACFLPNGLGNLLGAHIAGRLSDVIVKKYKRERNGIWYPEDRLRMTSIGALYLTPLSVSVAGLTMTYIGGRLGLTICLLCLFTNGVGVNMVLTPMGSYVVDLMGPRSAEVMAAGGALRSFLLAPLSALIIPSINLTGIAVTNGIAAVLALIGYLLIWATIRHGDQLRTYLDIGYTTASN